MKNEFTKNITNTAAIEFLRLVSFKILNIMDASIDTITNWNKVVSKSDRVYHLGDFGFHSY